MNTDLATLAVGLLAQKTQGLAEMKIMKANHDMEMSLINMLSEVALSAPEPGTGLTVDKRA